MEKLKILSIDTTDERKAFFFSIGLRPDATVTLFFKNRTGIVVKAGKTKLALSSTVLREIKFEQLVEENSESKSRRDK